ncbi:MULTISPECIES: hypothetical protein [unclassified Pedobacter]|uniref:hypothetical protein n=1 Tax=unclassified Pedobacter TaxID=2628915 RepID=UPI001E4983C1|nr:MULTISPECIES: hypothetical protein [unclassified Pedobacter]
MENQDKNQNPKAEQDPQSLVETIIPSTSTEESKTTEVKHKITLETPKTGADDENVNKEDENDAANKNSEPESAKQEVESADNKDVDDDEGDKIETVAP